MKQSDKLQRTIPMLVWSNSWCCQKTLHQGVNGAYQREQKIRFSSLSLESPLSSTGKRFDLVISLLLVCSALFPCT